MYQVRYNICFRLAIGLIAFTIMAGIAGSAQAAAIIIPAQSFQALVDTFYRDFARDSAADPAFSQSQRGTMVIPNGSAWKWMSDNIPYFDCPDRAMREMYYWRWWIYRLHIMKSICRITALTPTVITEFTKWWCCGDCNNVDNMPAGHILYEGRWLHDWQDVRSYLAYITQDRNYTTWPADGAWATYLVRQNQSDITGNLSKLIAYQNYFTGAYESQSGLYQYDDWNAGTEYTIAGCGNLIHMNCEMYGNLRAIANIAKLAGNTTVEARYRTLADSLQSNINRKLWDSTAQFYKTFKNQWGHDADISVYGGSPWGDKYTPTKWNQVVGKLVNVREIWGYMPWYFNLADAGHENAWAQVMDPSGFYSPYGSYTAEKRHPLFGQISGGVWGGQSWFWATNVMLVGFGNLLNNYHQTVVTNTDYFNVLCAYMRGAHRPTAPATGTIPATCRPQAGESNGMQGTPQGDPYHLMSGFADVIITGLVGIRPQVGDTLSINPLVPAGTWDWFCLDNVDYHGHSLTVLYDRTGTKYGKGAGLRVYVDGAEAASSAGLAKLTIHLGSSAATQPALMHGSSADRGRHIARIYDMQGRRVTDDGKAGIGTAHAGFYPYAGSIETNMVGRKTVKH